LNYCNGTLKMNDDEHELGKAIIGIVMLSSMPIFWMLWQLCE
jgi:hypothetical protein